MRFIRLSQNGTIERIFEALQEMDIIDTGTDILCPDSTGIRAQAGARKSNEKQSIGRSKGG